MEFFKGKLKVAKLRKQIKSICSDADRLVQMHGDLLEQEVIADVCSLQKKLKKFSKQLCF